MCDFTDRQAAESQVVFDAGLTHEVPQEAMDLVRQTMVTSVVLNIVVAILGITFPCVHVGIDLAQA